VDTVKSVLAAFSGLRFQDLVDIFILYVAVYYLIVFFKETRTMQMLKGLAVLLAMSLLAQFLELHTIGWILVKITEGLVFAFVVIFAPELRQIFVDIGQRRIRIRSMFKSQEELYSVIVDACKQMLKKRVGCLIVIEREVGLREYIETGSKINADITSPLLLTIFFPKTQLHDGAVIISHGKIAAAGCVLPLTQKSDIDPELGMRHRAALGLTEITDAVAIVVSEDLRNISLSVHGKITPGIQPENLKEMLEMYGKKS